mgnify:CR=1 FL=1
MEHRTLKWRENREVDERKAENVEVEERKANFFLITMKKSPDFFLIHGLKKSPDFFKFPWTLKFKTGLGPVFKKKIFLDFPWTGPEVGPGKDRASLGPRGALGETGAIFYRGIFLHGGFLPLT